MVTQLGLFEAIMDILYLKPLFIFGLVLIGLLAFWLLKKDKKQPNLRIVIGSILMFYYLCIVFKNIVGIPTINELFGLSHLGESFFNPNINLIPLDNGVSLEFILNIICFIPLGFLCPIISKTHEQIKKVVLFGSGISLMIEISQLFTLYRATDINDLIANVLGTVIGYLSFKLFVILGVIKSSSPLEKDSTRFMPTLIVIFAYAITFIS
ncbi:VanZ family protein [Bacillus sp. 1P06AnD]|uniref:VanZ family protein n=1 Tax=Bacillus sp. 1P06AnD TaxID=3132208 RepID=UPI0039A078C0